MLFRVTILPLLQLGGTAAALPTEQQPINAATNSALKVQAELRKAEIIPTVIDDFLPSLTLSVSWPKKDAKLGNTIKPKVLQDRPSVSLYDETSDTAASSNMTYVITLTDPDAPSRDNPEWSEMCHWIASNLTITQQTFSIPPVPFFSFRKSDEDENVDEKKLEEVMEYKPPGPPPKTGKHRYVFLVFAPGNGTTEELYPSKPKDRQHWGTGEERSGVREWATENGLVPVAANFIYSQHKKQ